MRIWWTNKISRYYPNEFVQKSFPKMDLWTLFTERFNLWDKDKWNNDESMDKKWISLMIVLKFALLKLSNILAGIKAIYIIYTLTK